MSNQFTEEQIESFARSWREPDLASMLGKTFYSVTTDDVDYVRFHHEQGTIEFYYDQDCCASCYIESIDGDIADLVGHPLLMAELVTSDENPKDEGGYFAESFTWSFYKFATVKGYVTVRWYGSSNGYYSETVSTKWLPVPEGMR